MIELKIMLIEEDGVLAKKLTQALFAQKYRSKEYRDLACAIADFEDFAPNLIVADIQAFAKGDQEQSSFIQNGLKATPIIITAAADEMDLLQQIDPLKIDCLIPKPINTDLLLVSIQKITHNLRLRKNLEKENLFLNQYRHIIDQSTCITIVHKTEKIKYVNEKFCKLSGYSKEELVGASQKILRDPNVSKKFFQNLWETILAKRVWKGILKSRRKDGTAFYVEATISPIVDLDNEIQEFIAVQVDITDTIINQKQLERAVITDKLTDLPNRLHLKTKLKNCTQCSQIMLINIDRFKDVNILFGINCGDNMLIYLAQSLQQARSSQAFKFFRIAADEFIVLYQGEEKNALRKYLDLLKKQIQTNPFEFQGITFDIEFTSIIMQYCDISPTLIEDLQRAMNWAKKMHKEIMFYEDIKHNDNIYKHNFQWLTSIKNAINEQRLELFFQPLYDIKKTKITKYEALIRLIEPDGRVVTPDCFLQAAKLSKSYHDLTRIVITQACEKSLHVRTKISINLSIEDLEDKETIQFLIDSVERNQLQHKLIVEVLESEGIDNFELISTVFAQLKKAGLEIAIDDFGSGYSNFSYLVNLPIDMLKIDGSLVKNLATDIKSKILVEHIVLFAKELGIKCIAEFVSNKEIFEIVQELGVDIAQGYYIGQPTRELDVQLPQGL